MYVQIDQAITAIIALDHCGAVDNGTLANLCYCATAEIPVDAVEINFQILFHFNSVVKRTKSIESNFVSRNMSITPLVENLRNARHKRVSLSIFHRPSFQAGPRFPILKRFRPIGSKGRACSELEEGKKEHASPIEGIRWPNSRITGLFTSKRF